MSGSRFLAGQIPGGLLSAVQGMMTANEALVIQAITAGTYFYFNEIPTNSGDDVHFTLAHTPNPAASLEVFLNGLKQTVTTNYSLSGLNLTMNSYSPGDEFYVNYTVSPV